MIAQRLLLHRSRLNSSRVTAQHLYEALMSTDSYLGNSRSWLTFPRNSIRGPAGINLAKQDFSFPYGIGHSISESGGRFFIQKH